MTAEHFCFYAGILSGFVLFGFIKLWVDDSVKSTYTVEDSVNDAWDGITYD